jgi:hypothetical protein
VEIMICPVHPSTQFEHLKDGSPTADTEQVVTEEFKALIYGACLAIHLCLLVAYLQQPFS